jgi:type III secretion protein J
MTRPRAGSLALLLLAAIALAGCERRQELLSRLSEADANAAVRVLRERGVDATKVYRKEGVTIEVSAVAMVPALETLERHGLPRGEAKSLGDVFKKDGLVATPLEERARYVYALSRELESTIQAIDGVVLARVLVVLPDRMVPGEPVHPSSASVFVKHRPEFDPDLMEAHIARLVGAGIPGLSETWSRRVNVVFVQTAVAAPRVGGAAPDGAMPAPGAAGTAQWWWTLGVLVAGAAGGAWYWLRRRVAGAGSRTNGEGVAEGVANG